MIQLSTQALSLNKDLAYTLTLADHHGCWCAWCLDYIKTKSELEGHHIWPRAALVGLLGKGTIPLDCLVPVHKNLCHREGFQKYSDIAGVFLRDIQSLDPHEFDRTCYRAFLEGDLTKAVFLREWASQRDWLSNDPEARYQNLIFELNALAGSSMANLLTRPPRRGDASTWLEKKIRQESITSELLTYSGSVLVNGGHIGEGLKLYQQVSSTVPRWYHKSDELNGVITRRLATATCEIKYAREAVELAVNHDYTLRTALLSLGWTRANNQDYSGARDVFDDITDQAITAPISWLHRAGKEFGVGCAVYLQERLTKLEQSLARLLKAQYIYAFLGLQSAPVPDPRKGAYFSPEPVTPSEVIRWIGENNATKLSSDFMMELRKKTLRAFRKPLIETLTRPNSSPF